MTPQDFPSFVHTLPEAEMAAPGRRGWLLQGERGQVLYHESDVEVELPEHVHGEHWGVVLKGRIELTIDGRIRIYTRGDTYHIPEGAQHRVHIFPGFRAVEHLGDPNGYQVKK